MQAWNAEMQRIAIADAVCEPRRADTRRSLLRARYFPHDVRFSRHGFRFTGHGGLTPAAPSCVFATFRTMFDSRGTACGSPNHGGLTPAAHVNVRLCIANGALCSERTSCTRSGWREPAVVREANVRCET
jgi:hypothetical protein